MKKLLLKGGSVVSPRGVKRADVLISGEKIVAVGRRLAADAQTVNVSGKLIFPGFIDAQTEFEAQVGETTSCDDFDAGTKCALAGGVTTVINCAVQNKGESLTDALNDWHVRAFSNASCDYAFYMTVTDWNEAIRDELPAMFEQGVTSFKAAMSGDGALDDSALLELMTELGHDGLLSCRCENAAIVRKLRDDAIKNGDPSPAAFARLHPDYAEAEAVHRFLSLARAADAPCAVTLSSAAGYAEVRRALESGVRVYASTCPRYLLLDESLYSASSENSELYLCIPPLRRPVDNRVLWEALSSGRLQTVSGGHRAFTIHKKRISEGGLDSVADGLPEIQTLALLLYNYGVKRRRLSLQQLCAYLSENPARLYGMYPKKGAIKAGSDADIVVFNPKGGGVISAAHSLSNAGYSPYEGMSATGRIEQVYLRGQLAYRGGEVVLEHSGRYIPRGKGSL